MNEQRIVMRRPLPYSSGFTLLEMAVVLMIIGLLLGGLIPTLSAQMDGQRSNKTQKQLNEIKDAINGFAVINGRLPWPACGTIAAGQANAGIELSPASAPLCTSGASDISVVPWATLGVEETDAWGRRFTYSVTPEFADSTDGTGVATCSIATGVSFQLCSTATLEVRASSPAGAIVASDIPAVIVSHGINGLGAYQPVGSAKISGATGDELENSDNDNTFVSKDQVQGGFDDLVVWLSPNTLANRMVTAGKLP